MLEQKQRYIKWSREELDQLCQYIEDKTKDEPELRLMSIIQRAQVAMLPKERHRTAKSASLFGRCSFMAFSSAHQRGLQAATLVKPPPTPPPAPAPAKEPVKELVKEPVMEEKHEQNEPLETMATAAIVGELFVRLTKLVVERVELRLDRIEQAVIDSFLTKNGAAHCRPPSMALVTKEKIKPNSPVLTVVGLMRDQFEHVREKCSDTCFDLRWVDAEKNAPGFPSTHYIVCQKHLGHRWYDAAQAKVGSDHLAFADGGISKVVQRIWDFNARELALAARR